MSRASSDYTDHVNKGMAGGPAINKEAQEAPLIDRAAAYLTDRGYTVLPPAATLPVAN